MTEFLKKKCVPCEGKIPAMSIIEEDINIKKLNEWTLHRDGIHKISKMYEFEDFNEAIQFVNKVAILVEEEGHHPDIYIYYNKVKFELYTHAVNGLFLNDFIVAAKIDELLK